MPGMPADEEGESHSPNLVEVKGSEAQGRHREVGSEGLKEHHRVVIEESYPQDKPVGRRLGMVEPAL